MIIFSYIYFIICFRRDKLQITLWSKLTEKFDENVVRAMAEPIAIALVALSIKQYRGNLFLLYYQEYKYIYIFLS